MSTPGLSEKASLAQPADEKAVPPHLRCNSCSKPVFNAFQTPHGCRICQSCVQAKLHPTERRLCPGTTEACKDEDEEIRICQSSCVPDIATRREISKLTVFCPNRDGGCKDQMKWREVDTHLEKCEYEKVSCELCRDSILKKRLKSHLSDECRERRVTCGLCQQSVVHSEMEKSHRNLDSATCCPRYTDYCPFCKDKSRKLNRKEFVEHLKTCPDKPNECKYSHLGCERKARKSDLEKHYRDEVDNHLTLLDSKLRQVASGSSFAPPTAATAAATVAPVGGTREVEEVKRKVANIHYHFKKLQVNVANWAHTTLEFEQMADKFGGISQTRQFLKNLDEKIRQMETPGVEEQRWVTCDFCKKELLHSDMESIHRNLESATCCPRYTDYCPFCKDKSRKLNRKDFVEHAKICSKYTVTISGLLQYLQDIGTRLRLTSNLSNAEGTVDASSSMVQQKLNEIEFRLLNLESTNYDGFLVWKVSNFTKRRREAIDKRVTSIFSQPFLSRHQDFKFRVRLFLNGNKSGKGSHVSVYLVLMQHEFDDIQEWPLKATVSFKMVNLRNRADDVAKTVRFDSGNQRPSGREDLSVCCGEAKFMSISQLENSDRFVKNDSFYLEVDAAVDGESGQGRRGRT
ncbi:hypothetical protein BOX15_Mlig010453g3 [Macrostomum lignano]|uniref:TRAF-type domain-containing protein n=1 Tax=Macrostomum lignano TaxID=282301 RepID=A0A267ELW0_9PLAT|nr:hypothetical protein BOX15_Mlig010453g3 [Macrostomum lignano]